MLCSYTYVHRAMQKIYWRLYVTTLIMIHMHISKLIKMHVKYVQFLYIKYTSMRILNF